MLDTENPGSILSSVEQARENARTVREQLSTELWESLNSFCLQLRGRNLRADLEFQPHELYGMVRRQCQTVAGVAAETMARDEGWRFFMLGWNLERAEMACRLLSVRYRQLSPSAFHEWMGTLRSASALEAYRRTYRASMDPVDVVEFLLLSRTFPRSVLFSLRTAENQLDRLAPEGAATRPLRQLGRVCASLEYADVRELMQGDLGAELHVGGGGHPPGGHLGGHPVLLQLPRVRPAQPAAHARRARSARAIRRGRRGDGTDEGGPA